MAFARLQGTYADHLPGDFLALFIGDRNDHTVFARLAAARMMNRAFDAHGRDALRLRLGSHGIEAQVVVAAGANTGA